MYNWLYTYIRIEAIGVSSNPVKHVYILLGVSFFITVLVSYDYLDLEKPSHYNSRSESQGSPWSRE